MGGENASVVLHLDNSAESKFIKLVNSKSLNVKYSEGVRLSASSFQQTFKKNGFFQFQKILIQHGQETFSGYVTIAKLLAHLSSVTSQLLGDSVDSEAEVNFSSFSILLFPVSKNERTTKNPIFSLHDRSSNGFTGKISTLHLRVQS